LLKFSVFWPRTLSQDQGQGQGLETRGREQGHSSLSSRRFEDKDKSLKTHHWS